MPCLTSPGRAAGRVQEGRLPIRQALALGALHGPAELLPVSSSAHVSVLPWLLGWSYAELDDEVRKSFEVTLHAGSAVGWLMSPQTGGGRARGPGHLPLMALTLAPPAAAGLVLERPIERRLGTPASIAAGLALGGLMMAGADHAPERRGPDEARPADALWLGLAQACALAPGISRTGATLVAARLRGFRAGAAWQLSARAATPVIAGAAGLKLARLIQRRPSGRETAGLLAGAGASCGSTLLFSRLLRPVERAWPLAPFAIYRLALAGAVAGRLRRCGQMLQSSPVPQR
jgi:undecaprenyl-diphosphatase